MKPNRTSAA
jgi:hypothetical protein